MSSKTLSLADMTEGKSTKLSVDFYSCALSSMGIRRGNYPKEGLWSLSFPLLSAHLRLPSAVTDSLTTGLEIAK